MPTRNKPGTADIQYHELPIPENFDRRGIEVVINHLYRWFRFDGLSPRQAQNKPMDPDVRHLDELAIGLFDDKQFILPRRWLPKTERDLVRFCRELIDRGQDEHHVELVLRGWPEGWNIERHADALWRLRSIDRMIFEDVVRGRHGRALRRMAGRTSVGGVTIEYVRACIVRQGLLWCALDAQLTTVRARISFTAPMGKLISGTMKIIKPGTVLKLMRTGLLLLRHVMESYQTVEEERRDGARTAKVKGKSAKLIYFFARPRVERAGRDLSKTRNELDECIPHIREQIPQIEDRLEFFERWNTEQLPPRRTKAGHMEPRTNVLRHFHPMWYSNLTPAAGMAVGLFRLVMAERHLSEMVDAAADATWGPNWLGVPRVDPLPALPTDPRELAVIIQRVFDLSDSARRTQLRDPDWRSRSLKLDVKDIQAAIEADPVHAVRDPLDRAGATFINDARRFLNAMGQRRSDAFSMANNEDSRHFTFWRMDVVPEVRLSI